MGSRTSAIEPTLTEIGLGSKPYGYSDLAGLRLFSELYRLFQHPPLDPAGVVFPVQGIARKRGPLFPAVKLIVHAMEGQRLDLRAGGDMKIGIFVPAIRVEEKFADAPGWFWRQ